MELQVLLRKQNDTTKSILIIYREENVEVISPDMQALFAMQRNKNDSIDLARLIDAINESGYFVETAFIDENNPGFET